LVRASPHPQPLSGGEGSSYTLAELIFVGVSRPEFPLSFGEGLGVRL